MSLSAIRGSRSHGSHHPRSPGAPVPADARQVVLVRLRSIGDAVLLLPLLAALGRSRPRARSSLVLEEPAASLLRGQPGVDEVIACGRSLGGRLRALARLRAIHADVAIDLHGGPTAAALTRFCGASRRIGLAAFRNRRAYDILLPSPYKGATRSVTLHTLASNRALAAALGLDVEGWEPPRLVPSAAGDAEAAAALAAEGAPATGFVLVHPGAALRSKTWSPERFARVAAALAGDGHAVVVAGVPGTDRDPVAGLPAAVATLPALSLPGFLALAARARLFVGNDSGPAHVAAAAGIPTVTLFGSQDPRVWRPAAARGAVLWRGLACSPCPGFGCANPVAFECLETIPVDEVVAASRSLLAAG